jgi:hypothetical protein
MAGDIEWKITHGGTPSEYTGPSSSVKNVFDEASDETNRYLYLEASEADEDQRTILYSSHLKHASCVSFYYFMHGETMGTLRVFSETSSKNINTIWELSGDQGQFWQKISLTVNPTEKFYQIGIEAVRGRTFKSDIAIDDLVIQDGICPTVNECSFVNPQERV